jgi:hypothetical protein
MEAFNLDPANPTQNLLLVPAHYGDNYYAPIHGSNVGGQGNTVNIANYHSAVDPMVVIQFLFRMSFNCLTYL